MSAERLAFGLIVLTLAGCGPWRASADPPQLGQGIAVGEVTSSSAVIWGRCDRAAVLRVQLEGATTSARTSVGEATDFTGRVVLADLAADTAYAYAVACGDGDQAARHGRFRTAPAPSDARPVRIAWGGDVGGQNVCRDRHLGYPIFARIAPLGLDFFIGLGDMIYADDGCHTVGRYRNGQLPGPGPATTLEGYRAHWRYNWSEENFRQLRAATPYFAVWDDHEIRNDSGPHDDAARLAPGGHLLPIALQTFLEYQPLVPPAGDPTRLYRSVRWGKHVEVFLLDTRQYRDALAAPDSDARPKTMLGAAQLAWLTRALAGSDATWKIIVASVPLAIPTGSEARDGFAGGASDAGYEREAAAIFAALRDHGIRDSIWLTTDVHFATGFAYRPFVDDPGWMAHEFISGPLNAGIFPSSAVDPTFRPERLFTYAPASADAIPSYAAALGWFNFGVVEVAADGALTVEIINGNGERVFRYSLQPAKDTNDDNDSKDSKAMLRR